MTADDRGHQVVLHDRPPPHFKRTAAMLEHELLQRLIQSFSRPLPPDFSLSDARLFTRFDNDGYVKAEERPALVLSSTSWTADEDFGPLLTALDVCQEAYERDTSLPRILVVITGKGELRKAFEEQVEQREKQWKGISVRCVFVAVADYPLLLGCADLGVSMHSSSSGRDLPMKVVDMFGCGVPVLARDFQAIGELVKEDVNGKTWSTGEELGKQMVVSSVKISEKAKLRPGIVKRVPAQRKVREASAVL